MPRWRPVASAVLLVPVAIAAAKTEKAKVVAEPPAVVERLLEVAGDRTVGHATRLSTAEEAFRLAGEHRRPDLQAEALLNKAHVLFEQDSLRLAMEALREARALDPGSDAYLSFRIGRRVADIYYRLGAHERAIRGYLEARRLLDRVREQSVRVDLSRAHLSVCIGNVWRESRDLEEALVSYREALDLYEAKGALEFSTGTRLNLANVLFDLRRYEEALREYEVCAHEAASRNDRNLQAIALNGLAAAALAVGDTAGSERSLEAAMASLRETGRGRGMLHAQKTLGDLRMHQGRAKAAHAAYTEALELATKLDDATQVAELYRLRARADSALGFYREAYADLVAAHRVRQHALERARIDAVRNLGIAYEVERKEEQIVHLAQIAEARSARAKMLTVAVALAVLLLAGIGWGLSVEVRAAKAAKEANRRLAEAYAEVEALSITDPLTGLFNRRKAMERLREEHERSVRTGRPFSVGIVDLDDFKEINDTQGHAAGDHALQRVAAHLASNVRTIDCVARWGGDEFLLILTETSAEDLTEVINRLQPPSAGAADPFPSCSIGFATSHGQDLADLLREADEALYAAKAQGKGRAAVRSARHVQGSGTQT